MDLKERRRRRHCDTSEQLGNITLFHGIPATALGGVCTAYKLDEVDAIVPHDQEEYLGIKQPGRWTEKRARTTTFTAMLLNRAGAQVAVHTPRRGLGHVRSGHHDSRFCGLGWPIEEASRLKASDPMGYRCKVSYGTLMIIGRPSFGCAQPSQCDLPWYRSPGPDPGRRWPSSCAIKHLKAFGVEHFYASQCLKPSSLVAHKQLAGSLITVCSRDCHVASSPLTSHRTLYYPVRLGRASSHTWASLSVSSFLNNEAAIEQSLALADGC